MTDYEIILQANIYHKGEKMDALYLKIVDELKDKINNQEYQQGDKLPSERALATSYKVSRIVIREAIRILRSEGLVEVFPGKEAYITKPNSIFASESIETVMKNYNTTLEDILEFREGLELSIIKNVIKRASTEDIQTLYLIYYDMEKCRKNITRFVELDEQFHLYLAKYTKNSLYEMFLQSFIEMTQHVLFEFTSLIPDSIEQAQNHHLALIRFIEKRNQKGALDIMKTHMQLLRDEIKILKDRKII